MAKYEGGDRYLDPQTGVLRNRLGIADERRLEAAEASLVAWRSYELSQKPQAGDFDLAHLQAIHRPLFGDVYDWAGEIRTIDLSKGNTYFTHHAPIVSAARLIFENLKKERYFRGLNADAFSERAAYDWGEINALHPFREGNGRAQREFIHHLQDFRLEFHKLDYLI
ncbi:MAG TPA: Fic family protein [Candidatus Paceibacterota bacterium]|nr:Fic family protein [Candidatus Paceibacterota bacterium]